MRGVTVLFLLGIVYFICGCWTFTLVSGAHSTGKLSNPPPVIIPQLAPFGKVIATIDISGAEDDDQIADIPCMRCFKVGQIRNQRVDIMVRDSEWWTACRTQLTQLTEGFDSATGLMKCTARIAITVPRLEVNEVTLLILVNRAPSLTTPLDLNVLFFIKENFPVSGPHTIITLRSEDTDVNSPAAGRYYKRRLAIASCDPAVPAACPFRIVNEPLFDGSVCNIETNSISCDDDLPSASRFNLQLSGTLDYEKGQVHTVRLTLTDAFDQHESEQNVVELRALTIQVIDQQDTPPRFLDFVNQFDAKVLEFTAPYQDGQPLPLKPIMLIHARDGDISSPVSIRYEMCETAEFEGSTCLPPSQNRLRLIENPANTEQVIVVVQTAIAELTDDPASQAIFIKVTATEIHPKPEEVDQTKITSIAFGRITVVDFNDKKPTFLQIRNIGDNTPTPVANIEIEVDEDALVGATVHVVGDVRVLVRDNDQGANAAFTLEIIDDDGRDLFELTQTVGQREAPVELRVKRAGLDAERETTFTMRIRARHSGIPAEPTHIEYLTVTVNIRDVNDHRTFIRQCTPTSDPAVGTLSLTVRETIYPGPESLLLDLTQAGTLTDDDETDGNRRQPQFRLIEPSPCFAMSSDGKFQVVNKLDYDTNVDTPVGAPPEHVVEIEVNNIGYKASLQSVCRVTIVLQDVNDEPPKFDENPDSLYEFSYNENQQNAPGTHVYQVRATDTDFNAETSITAKLKFSIELQQALSPIGVPVRGFKLENHIRIETIHQAGTIGWLGNIIVTFPFDRELTETIHAVVKVVDENALDKVSQTAQISLIIHVLDVNDNKPLVKYNYLDVTGPILFEVREFTREPIPLDFYITDTDSAASEEGHKFIATLTVPPEDEGQVVIAEGGADPSLIRLIIRGPFEYSKVKNLEYKLTISDGVVSPQTSEVVLRLKILDINNYPPRVVEPLPYDETDPVPVIKRIPETDSRIDKADFKPALVLTVKAEDLLDSVELTEPFEYFLTYIGSSDLVDIIVIDKDTGEVTAVQPLDREALGMQRVIKLQVYAKDNGKQDYQRDSPKIEFAVQLTDVNDNPPVFSTETGFAVTLLEKENTGNVVFANVVKATDADLATGCGGKVKFSLVTLNVPVTIDPNTAAVTLTERITGNLQFKIEAADNAEEGCGTDINKVTTDMTITLLRQELLYEIIVDLETVEGADRNATLGRIETLLINIGKEKGYDYVRHSITEPQVRVKAPKVINFSYLSRETRESAPSDEVTRWLAGNANTLQAAGVRNIGTSVLVNAPKERGFDEVLIGVIVLSVAVVILVFTVIVFYSEIRKIARKLKAYKAAAAAVEGQDNKGLQIAQKNFSPYTAGGTQKQNPIIQKYGNNLDNKLFLQLDGHSYTDEDLDGLGSETRSQVQETDDSSLPDLEAGIAQANRKNLHIQLHEAGY